MAAVERVLTMRVTAQFFDVLGVRPARGRTISEAEAQRREGCVALVAHDVAHRTPPEPPSARPSDWTMRPAK